METSIANIFSPEDNANKLFINIKSILLKETIHFPLIKYICHYYQRAMYYYYLDFLLFHFSNFIYHYQ